MLSIMTTTRTKNAPIAKSPENLDFEPKPDQLEEAKRLVCDFSFEEIDLNEPEKTPKLNPDAKPENLNPESGFEILDMDVSLEHLGQGNDDQLSTDNNFYQSQKSKPFLGSRENFLDSPDKTSPSRFYPVQRVKSYERNELTRESDIFNFFYGENNYDEPMIRKESEAKSPVTISCKDAEKKILESQKEAKDANIIKKKSIISDSIKKKKKSKVNEKADQKIEPNLFNQFFKNSEDSPVKLNSKKATKSKKGVRKRSSLLNKAKSTNLIEFEIKRTKKPYKTSITPKYIKSGVRFSPIQVRTPDTSRLKMDNCFEHDVKSIECIEMDDEQEFLKSGRICERKRSKSIDLNSPKTAHKLSPNKNYLEFARYNYPPGQKSVELGTTKSNYSSNSHCEEGLESKYKLSWKNKKKMRDYEFKPKMEDKKSCKSVNYATKINKTETNLLKPLDEIRLAQIFLDMDRKYQGNGIINYKIVGSFFGAREEDWIRGLFLNQSDISLTKWIFGIKKKLNFIGKQNAKNFLDSLVIKLYIGN